MFDRWRAWWRRQDDILTLQSLSDRMLADMGVERSAIRDLVMGRPEPGLAWPGRGEPPLGPGAALAER